MLSNKTVKRGYRKVIIPPLHSPFLILTTLALFRFVTGFWKISLNVTFYNSNIYNQNEELELPINLKVVTMCSSHLELPKNNWKYFEKFCNPFVVVTINCVILCISM